MIRKIKQQIQSTVKYLRLPPLAKAEFHKDKAGLPLEDPGVDKAIHEGVAWLCRAQDNSLTKDGGVARHYSAINGWASSYPETTGYIITTLFDYADVFDDDEIRLRAFRMLDWLVSIQLPEGAFQGGMVDELPVVPVTFNTGQILLGLARGAREDKENYYEPMCKAADWLMDTQDDDGCWRKNPTPFAKPGDKSYETHVAWGLLEAALIAPGKGYAKAAVANVDWALTNQQDNGWFSKCCLYYPDKPLTHTLGYVLRGIIEAYRFTKDDKILESCARTGNGLLNAMQMPHGYLPGRLYSDWQGAVNYVCLTGSAQIAHCLLLLYQFTREKKFLNAGLAANRFVRRTMRIDGPEGIRGGIKGSFPINGRYGYFEYLNWACKFFVDSNMLEKNITANSKSKSSATSRHNE